jgi:hypothetical protein
MTLPWTSSSNANQQIYPTGLASYLSQVFGWDPSFGLQSDPEWIEKVTRDTACSGALDHLCKLIVGHDFFYEASDDTPEGRKLAKIVEQLQKQTRDLPATWYNLAGAVWKGAAWARLKLEKRVLRIGDGKPRVWTVLAEAKDVDKRRFRLSRVLSTGPEAPESRDATGSFAQDWRWEFYRVPGARNYSSSWTPIEEIAPKEQWLQFVVDTSEKGLAFGWGMAEDLFFNLFAKTAVFRSLLQGIDRWGQGFLVQKVAGLRDGDASGYTPEEKVALVVAALRKYRSQNVYAMDAGDDIEILDGPADAINACMQVVQYLDKENRIRILAAVETTGAGEGSSFGQSKVEEGSSDANVAFLRAPLEETWTRNVARLLVTKNRKNLAELGLADWLAVPRLRLRGRKTSDPERAALVLKTARELGLPILRAEAYSMLELTAPILDELKPDEILDWKNLATENPQVASRLDGALEQASGANGAVRGPVGTGGESVAENPARERAAARLVRAGAGGDM